MKTKLHNFSLLSFFAFAFLFLTVPLRAQNFVFHAEFLNNWSAGGYPFVNDINGYPSITVEATSSDDEFIIEADSYYNKWNNSGTCNFNTITPFVFYGNTPSYDPGNTFLTSSTVSGKFYTTRIKNNGYSNTSAIIMETDTAPVSFIATGAVTQLPVAQAVPINTPVQVTVNIDRPRNPQEKLYIRYTVDNWANSNTAEVVFLNTNDLAGIATIPGQAAGTQVKYYALSTVVVIQPGGIDYDLITLKQETNSGANYEYTVLAAPIGNAQITFQVNMAQQTVSAQGVFLAGSFNGFSATADSMILVGNNIYELTLSLDTTATINYKFVNGSTFESVNATCGVDDGFGGYNRVLHVPDNDSVLPFVCFNECSNCVLPGFADVTFQVNMAQQTVSAQGVFLAGSFNGFSTTADSMILVGNNIYELTLSLDTTATINYKFVNGSTFESVNATCGVDDGFGGYNRVLHVPDNDTVLSLVCFNECSNCVLPGFADVTFQVNMAQQTVSAQGVFLAGSFNGFSTTADSMILVGNNVYELTLSLDTTATINYKFVNGSTFESVNATCGVDDGFGGYNRVLNVPDNDTVLSLVCFNECSNCVLPGFADVTFQVNMAQQTVSAQGVFLAGSFNGFSATADSMILVGNNIYELTLSLDTTATINYKFVNGSTFESVNATCGVDDGFGGYNRVLHVPDNDTVLSIVCFNECFNCVPVGISKLDQQKVNLYPNPANDYFVINALSAISFQIVAADGSIAKEGSLAQTVEQIDIRDVKSGFYIVKIYQSNTVHVKPLIKK